MNDTHDMKAVDLAELRNLKEVLARGIKRERDRAGMTQRELAAAALGDEERDYTIASYENKRRLPPLNVLVRISKALGDRRGSVDRLLGLRPEHLEPDEADLLNYYRDITETLFQEMALDAVRALWGADRERSEREAHQGA